MTRNRSETDKGSGGARTAPPLLFLLALAVFAEGGDWPPAAFLIRFGILLLSALFLLRRDAAALRVTVPDLLLAAFLLWEAACLSRGAYLWVSLQWFSLHAAAFLLYLLVRGLKDPDRRFPAAAGTILAGSCVLQLILALYQKFVVGTFLFSGTLQNPSLLAEFLLYGAAAAWYGTSGGSGTASRIRIVRYSLIALFAAGILLTRSRGGFLLLMAATAYALAAKWGWKRILAGVAAAAVLTILVPNPLRDRFRGVGDPFSYERAAMWRAAVRIARDRPLGAGTGHFKYLWPAVREPVEGTIIRYGRAARTPDSEFFSVLSELGFPGAALFLSLGAAGFVTLRRASRSNDPAAKTAAAVTGISFLHGFVQGNYHVQGILLVNAAAWAVAVDRLWTPVRIAEVRLRGPVRPAGLALLAVFLLHAGVTLVGAVLESRGLRHLQEGRPVAAEGALARAAAADPWRSTAPDALSAARFRLYEAGRGEDFLAGAVDAELEARLRNPVEFRYPARLGFLYAAAGEREPRGSRRDRMIGAAVSSYDLALKLNPHNAEVRYRKALVLRDAGRVDESRGAVEALLREEPRFARGWALLGELLEGVDGPGALEAYAKAVDLYDRYRFAAVDPEDKAFVALDDEDVRGRIRTLKKETGR